ncbi:glycosyltransferase [Actinospica sp. MGRD01-02]|uniref:Glycosyltransferase n=1 Tax=Actinospica acidithermotolerans TaxID=2828514 RepID=A0A941ILF2_9ACTN|nr:glycosyltransferase [Actinospica acidithermotolerans]MBR7829947.1 glycosyltransferase [Actinospica acidithermotolerans]
MSQYAPPTRSRAYAANPHEALRRHVVTAVLVSHDGERWLPTVLEALLNQQRPVQRVIAVDTGSRDRSADLLRDALGSELVLERKRSTGYGTAVAYGLKNSEPVGYDEVGYDADAPIEWVWLLHDDSAPSPDCLGQLLLTAEEYSAEHPSDHVAVVGPKVHGWYDRRQLLEVGVTVAGNGRRWTGLERGEHDQGQYDEVRPVLSVSSAGMLIRRDVWDQLKGFDRAISLFRDDLDFCWRANNAGFRVIVAPEAVIRHAEASARERRRVDAGPNRPQLLDRTHALYAVAVNRPSILWPLLYLRLIVGTFFRVLGHLIAKSPGLASDEFFAMLGFAARPDRILRGRASRRRFREADPLEVAMLLPPRGALTRAAFENLLTQIRGEERQDIGAATSRHGSVESGPVSEEAETLETDSFGLLKRLVKKPIIAVGLGLTAVALIAGHSLLFSGTLAGGALLPTPGGSSDLWHEYISAWHGVGLGTNTEAPAYLGLLALLSTILFGKASLAVLVLLLGSVPLAGLSASYAFRRVTDSPVLRIWGGYAYGLLSVSLGAIASGRLGSAVAVALLPLIVTSAAGAVGSRSQKGSTRSAWTCAFMLMLATAFAPVIWALAAVAGAIALVSVAWRTRSNLFVTATRMAIVLGTPLVVLSPWSVTLLQHPSSFLTEMGAPGYGLDSPSSTPLGLLLGDPGGPGTYPYWFGAGLLLTALAALLRGTRRRVVISAWMIALLGFVSALFLTRTTVTATDSAVGVVPWPGVSAALLGFGLITATLVGAEGARERIAGAEFGWRQPVSVLVTAAAVLAPVAAGGWWLLRGAETPVGRVSAGLPQYLAAENQSAAQVRTLTLTAGANGTVAYTVARGSGPVLGDADIHLTSAQTAKLNTLVGQLLSGSGGNAAQSLAALDIGYIWAASSVPASITNALGATSGLTEDTLTGSTGSSTEYWQVNGTVGRVTLQDAKGAAIALQYQCSGSTANPGTDAQGAAAVCSQDVTATVNVPGGSAGRVLVLAEAADGGWTAKENGQKLTATTLSDGLQAWNVPAGAGTITIGYQSYTHTLWLVGEAVAFAAALIMALPFGRRPEDEHDEEDEYAQAAAAAGEPGRMEPDPEPEPEPVAAAAAEPAYEPAPARERPRAYESSYEAYEAPQEPVPVPLQAEAPATENYEAPDYEAPVYETSQAASTDAYRSEGGDYGYESGAYQQYGQSYESYPQQDYDQAYDRSGAYQNYESYPQQPQQQGYEQYGYAEQQESYGYEQQQYQDPQQYQQQYQDPQYQQHGQYPQEQYQPEQYQQEQHYQSQEQQYPNADEQYPEFEQYPGYGAQEQHGQEGWGR